ncbi:hypothetical protein O6H91_Y427900 [Diphasiastrum complanatum]|nr:hypothetical protein O6H91_Y427900 [Diphasiastrum complanatum]
MGEAFVSSTVPLDWLLPNPSSTAELVQSKKLVEEPSSLVQNIQTFRWPKPFNENIPCFIPKTLSDCQIPPNLFGHPEFNLSSELIHSQIPFMHFPTFTLDPRFVPYENANSTASSQCRGSIDIFDLRPRGPHYGPIGSSGSSVFVNHGELFNVPQINSQDLLDAKALAASKSHSEAERRRRERINTHLATLRSLLPTTTKTDKASLLAEVINRVKELKRQAATMAVGSPVPSEVDELTVDTDTSYGEDKLLIKASLCCDDRRDLLTDLMRTLRSLRLRIVKAEMATVGGRIKNVILLTTRDGFSKDAQEMPSIIYCVQEALRAVIEGRLSGNFTTVGPVAILKKPRLCPLDVPTSSLEIKASSNKELLG